MGFLNKFLLGDLPHAVQAGAVAAGRRWHHSHTGLRETKTDKDKERETEEETQHSVHNLHFKSGDYLRSYL